MQVLVLGASGNTGKLVVKQLLERQLKTRVLIRENSTLPNDFMEHPHIEIIRNSISDMLEKEMDGLIKDCDVIISCLGHNISFKGMFGKPRYLVANAIISICESIKRSKHNKVKLILMSTTAYTNTILNEKLSMGEKIMFSIFKLLLPPHRDNMKAANYLLKEINNNDKQIEWVAVRPDTLIDEEKISSYETFASPVRSPIFNAGKTSRINVSHFMTELVVDKDLWNHWVFKTPVIYNK